jgi:hypothetical protein
MLAAIHLNHQAGFVAQKIRHIGSDRNLPAKLCFSDLAPAQRAPKLSLRVGQRTPERLRVIRRRKNRNSGLLP